MIKEKDYQTKAVNELVEKTISLLRCSGDRKKHVYGVAPYSLFRFQVNKRSDDLELDLENTAASVMVNAVERALA